MIATYLCAPDSGPSCGAAAWTPCRRTRTWTAGHRCARAGAWSATTRPGSSCRRTYTAPRCPGPSRDPRGHRRHSRTRQQRPRRRQTPAPSATGRHLAVPGSGRAGRARHCGDVHRIRTRGHPRRTGCAASWVPMATENRALGRRPPLLPLPGPPAGAGPVGSARGVAAAAGPDATDGSGGPSPGTWASPASATGCAGSVCSGAERSPRSTCTDRSDHRDQHQHHHRRGHHYWRRRHPAAMAPRGDHCPHRDRGRRRACHHCRNQDYRSRHAVLMLPANQTKIGHQLLVANAWRFGFVFVWVVLFCSLSFHFCLHICSLLSSFDRLSRGGPIQREGTKHSRKKYPNVTYSTQNKSLNKKNKRKSKQN